MYISLYVEEPLNSKVIKSFVSELRSRVFRVSRFLCSMYIYIYKYIYMNILCPFRISVSGHGTCVQDISVAVEKLTDDGSR